MEIMLDTNILDRLADQGDLRYIETKTTIQILQKQGNSLIFTPQIKREFLDIAERPKGTGPGKNGLGLTNHQTRQLLKQFKFMFTYKMDTPDVDRYFDEIARTIRRWENGSGSKYRSINGSPWYQYNSHL